MILRGDLVSTNVAEYLAIYDAVMQRDARATALTMRAHITAAARRLGYDSFAGCDRAELAGLSGSSPTPEALR